MTDRELLEAAAKAAGLDFTAGSGINIDRPGFTPKASTCWQGWNPLLDDGDALRLAVKLNLLVNISTAHTQVNWYDEDQSETHSLEQWDNGMTPEEWTRRAIVRAAAAIGSER